MLHPPRRRILPLLLATCLLLGAAPQPQVEALVGVRTFEIQGAAHRSPLVGRLVEDVPGVVTTVRSNGFTLQDPDGDGRPATSDAVLVFTRAAPTVAVGDRVRVSGTVREFRPGNDAANLTVTEIALASLVVDEQGLPLPPPVPLGAGGRTIPARIVAEGVSGDLEIAATFDPDAAAVDFFESLEAMRVEIRDAVAVGARGGRSELPVLPDDGAGVSGRTAAGGVLASLPGETPRRLVLSDGAVRVPPAGVGDRLPGPTVGSVDYAFGGYRVRVEELPPLMLGGAESPRVPPADAPDTLALATFNVENLSARERPARLARLAEVVVARLGAPDLLAVQEMQDDSGAADDGTLSGGRSARALAEAIRVAGGPAYEYREVVPDNNLDGGEPGANIRVGFLFRTDRGLTFVDRPGGDARTPVGVVADEGGGIRLTFSPGRIDPENPAWTDSRKPLVGEFTFNGHRLLVVACHFASKRGDGPLFGRFQPPPRPSEERRVEQARAVQAFVGGALAVDLEAHVVVLGDLNDVSGSATLAALRGDESGVLMDLGGLLPAEERYSYVFNGQSEQIDHILVSPGLHAATRLVAAVHGSAGSVGAASDHDPLVAHLALPPRPAAP